MPEQIDGIEYSVTANLSPLLKSQQVADKAANSIANSLEMVDVSAGSMNNTVGAAPTAFNKLTSAVRATNAQTTILPTVIKRVETEIKKTSKATTAYDGLLGKLTNSFKLQKGAAQQAGFQIQDMAVQLQGGTAFLTAFGQQASQLAGVLGPGGALLGAVIAIGAAVGGVLLTAFSGAGDQAITLNERMRALAEGTEAYGEALRELTILQLASALSESSEKVQALEKQIDGVRNTIEQTSKATNRYRGSASDVQALTDSLKDLENQLSLEIDTRTTLNATIENNIKNRNNESKEVERNAKTLDRLVKSLDLRAKSIVEVDGVLKKSARTEALLTAEILGADDAQKKSINTSFDRIEAVEKQAVALRNQKRAEAESARATAKAAREAEQQRRKAAGKVRAQTSRDTSVINDLKRQLATEEELINQSLEKQTAAILRQTSEGSQERSSLLLQAEELKNQRLLELTAKRLEEQDRLEQENAEKKRVAEIDAIEQQFNIDEQTAERLKELALEGENAAQSISSSFANALADVGDNFANTFASATVQGDSLAQSLRGVAQAFLTDILGSLIKVGARILINQAIGQSAATAGAATAAASGAAIAAAYGPAAALVSLATLGANAAPAQTALASTLALSKGLSAPGLATGGAAAQGKMYRVNERGPELFNDGARQFLIPDRNGEVVSNSDAKAGGGGNVNLNFNITNNSSGAGFEVESVNETNSEITINAIVTDIRSGGGPVSRALYESTNVTSRANN